MPATGPEHSAPRPACDLLVEHGDGPGVAVLLHAAGSGPRNYDRLARLLLPTVGRTLAPAFVAGGASMIASGPEPFSAAVDLVRSLIAGREGRPRLLVGHSMGGLVALLALSAGACIDAVVLYEPIVLSLLDPDDPADRQAAAHDTEIIARFTRCMDEGSPEAGVSQFIEAYGDHPWSALPERARADLVRRAPQILAEARATNAAAVPLDGLARIAAPVLILEGSNSPPITRSMARRLHARLPQSRMVTVSGTGHMGPITSPEAVADAIRPFLASVRR
jgi:pimeloyl-ACP methyl ester carboxylesterase